MRPGCQYMDSGHVWNYYHGTWFDHGVFVVMPGLIGGFGNWFVQFMMVRQTWHFPDGKISASGFAAAFVFCFFRR
ncbi:MAG: hypothetical protein CM15mP46_2400 [Alphaproteobacteria bacterium]|nr:MAG: hypothetical protein CM15mP46_2400 [Alphaproteobacteria bacterium]